ncbi:uncharacterized protein LOC128246974 isoform X1 [Octopus bimaculoides]|uniref:G-protein coupled receptors family 1 profile domain-containing protein n=1 Tax=Octopus bimaculoides TaxID=37653 RepID=A0A0L8HQ02_OCTBM|nr:uncharacterized protein LOC128246974 isoform X1 [Octopus bimaculoides]|eukprot:XP_014770520.1 PREDICTED: uncharacterized protein LOC106869328 isoform X2 [Octopus bimaculoides]
MEDIQMTTDYTYNYDYDYKVSVFGNDAAGRLNIFFCISIIIVVLFNLFLMVTIFLDRNTHGKTRSLSLLNYMLNYVLIALVIYFKGLHVYIVRDLPKYHCLFINIFLYAVNDGDKYFIIPLCCEFIVKYFKPRKYENQIFLIIQSVLIGILWIFNWIKSLVFFLAFSNFSTNNCFLLFQSNAAIAQFILALLLLITILIFIGLLIYIAIKGRDQEMMKSPLITLLIITIVTVILYLASYIFGIGILGRMLSKSFNIHRVINVVVFLLLPFLWLFDATIRQSIRTLYSRKYTKSNGHPSHELTEIN